MLLDKQRMPLSNRKTIASSIGQRIFAVDLYFFSLLDATKRAVLICHAHFDRQYPIFAGM
jgi:hypothetical protein